MVRPPYATVLRCYSLAEEHWEAIDGEAALQGRISLLTLPINRFCNAIIRWGVEHSKEPAKFVFEMEKPDGASASDAELEREAQQNAAFFSAFGVSAASIKDSPASTA